ncbi:hypothetical protein BC832DRAFT_559602 [Gaertneriomyces semiglobifer]|nr:hypothetical protein BC832DRAFT_559602 [Gaertneriomyces semiglobifer]
MSPPQTPLPYLNTLIDRLASASQTLVHSFQVTTKAPTPGNINGLTQSWLTVRNLTGELTPFVGGLNELVGELGAVIEEVVRRDGDPAGGEGLRRAEYNFPFCILKVLTGVKEGVRELVEKGVELPSSTLPASRDTVRPTEDVTGKLAPRTVQQNLHALGQQLDSASIQRSVSAVSLRNQDAPPLPPLETKPVRSIGNLTTIGRDQEAGTGLGARQQSAEVSRRKSGDSREHLVNVGENRRNSVADENQRESSEESPTGSLGLLSENEYSQASDNINEEIMETQEVSWDDVEKYPEEVDEQTESTENVAAADVLDEETAEAGMTEEPPSPTSAALPRGLESDENDIPQRKSEGSETGLPETALRSEKHNVDVERDENDDRTPALAQETAQYEETASGLATKDENKQPPAEEVSKSTREGSKESLASGTEALKRQPQQASSPDVSVAPQHSNKAQPAGQSSGYRSSAAAEISDLLKKKKLNRHSLLAAPSVRAAAKFFETKIHEVTESAQSLKTRPEKEKLGRVGKAAKKDKVPLGSAMAEEDENSLSNSRKDAFGSGDVRSTESSREGSIVGLGTPKRSVSAIHQLEEPATAPIIAMRIDTSLTADVAETMVPVKVEPRETPTTAVIGSESVVPKKDYVDVNEGHVETPSTAVIQGEERVAATPDEQLGVSHALPQDSIAEVPAVPFEGISGPQNEEPSVPLETEQKNLADDQQMGSVESVTAAYGAYSPAEGSVTESVQSDKASAESAKSEQREPPPEITASHSRLLELLQGHSFGSSSATLPENDFQSDQGSGSLYRSPPPSLTHLASTENVALPSSENVAMRRPSTIGDPVPVLHSTSSFPELTMPVIHTQGSAGDLQLSAGDTGSLLRGVREGRRVGSDARSKVTSLLEEIEVLWRKVDADQEEIEEDDEDERLSQDAVVSRAEEGDDAVEAHEAALAEPYAEEATGKETSFAEPSAAEDTTNSRRVSRRLSQRVSAVPFQSAADSPDHQPSKRTSQASVIDHGPDEEKQEEEIFDTYTHLHELPDLGSLHFGEEESKPMESAASDSERPSVPGTQHSEDSATPEAKAISERTSQDVADAVEQGVTVVPQIMLLPVQPHGTVPATTASHGQNQIMTLSQPIRLGRGTAPSSIPREQFRSFQSQVVSRSHAALFSRKGRVYIQDVGSNSGTFVNGARLSEAGKESDELELKSGDIIQLGKDYEGGNDTVLVMPEGRRRCVRLQVIVLSGSAQTQAQSQAAPEQFKQQSTDTAQAKNDMDKSPNQIPVPTQTKSLSDEQLGARHHTRSYEDVRDGEGGTSAVARSLRSRAKSHGFQATQPVQTPLERSISVKSRTSQSESMESMTKDGSQGLVKELGTPRTKFVIALSGTASKIKKVQVMNGMGIREVVNVGLKFWDSKKLITIQDHRPPYTTLNPSIEIFPDPTITPPLQHRPRVSGAERRAQNLSSSASTLTEISGISLPPFVVTTGTGAGMGHMCYTNFLKLSITPVATMGGLLSSTDDLSAAADKNGTPTTGTMAASDVPTFSLTGDLRNQKYIIIMRRPNSREQKIIGEAAGKQLVRKSVRENRWIVHVEMEEGVFAQLVMAGLVFVGVTGGWVGNT